MFIHRIQRKYRTPLSRIFAKTYCTMKPVIITGKGNTERSFETVADRNGEDEMMRNSKYNLVPYEVIERAITGDTAALLAVQEQHKAYIGRLSGGKRRYARAIKCKAAHGGFEVPTGLLAAAQVAKPKNSRQG